MKRSPYSLLHFTVLATGLLLSTTLLAGVRKPEPPVPVRVVQADQLDVKPSKMVSLVSIGNLCPQGGYALDQMVDPGTLARSPFSLAQGQALIVTNINGGLDVTRQTATDSVPVNMTISEVGSGGSIGLQDLVLKPGVTLCIRTNPLQHSNYLVPLSARGHIVLDN